MKETKVSVITPTFNSEHYIGETIDSIQRQTHGNWELLITDDCSSDSTIDLIERRMAEDGRIHLFKNSENLGAAASRNQSLANATGDYVAFLDSDDLWLPEKLSLQLDFMRSRDVNFSFTAYELIDEQGHVLNKTIDCATLKSVGYTDLLAKKVTLGCSTVMLSRRLYNGLKMPPIRTGQDYATWLNLLKTGEIANCLQTVLTRYRLVPNSISRNKFQKAKRQWQIYRELEQIDTLPAMRYFVNYAWHAVFR